MSAGHVAPTGPVDKVLWFSFFALGMGLMAPWSGILQTMDYMVAVFGNFNPSRILTVCYVTVDLIALFVLFFFPQVWPNRKSRMAAGYIIFTAVLVILPIVDFVMLHYAVQSMGAANAKVAAYVVWAVASATVGGSDALISTVAYSESAAIGPKYTHAFIGGKALSGMTLSVLRCISKLSMPQTIDGLKRSTSIYLAFAAAIVFVCVIVVLVVLPKKQKEIDALKKRPGLSVAQTLKVMHTFKQQQLLVRQATLHARKRHSLDASDGSFPSASSSSNNSLPRTLQTAASPGHGKLERAKTLARAGADAFNHLRAPTYGLFDVINAALASSAQPASDLEKGPSMPQVAEESEEKSSSSSSDGDAEPHALLAGTTASKDLDQPAKQTTAQSWREAAGMALHQQRHQQAKPAAAEPAGAAAAAHSPRARSPRAPRELRFSDAEATVVPSSPRSPRSPKDADIHQVPAAAYVSAFAASAAQKPKHQLPRSHASLRRFAAGGLVRDGLSVAASSWLAMKLVYPYMIAVCLVFFVANAIFPMCLSPERGEWAAAGTWYTLILVLAYESGTLLGSTLPIWRPKFPRTTVLSMSLGMFAFVPAYVLALLLKGGPGAFVTLTFLMMTYGGYIAAMVFVLAPHGLLTADAELVEVLLVLVLTVGYILGLFLSWLWKLPGLSPHAGGH